MPDDLIVRHPPERGGSTSRAVLVCSGCCCLMYLHSVGALLGAFLAGGVRRSRQESSVYFDLQQRIPLVHAVFRRLPNQQWLFWSSLVLVIPLCVPLVVGLITSIESSSYEWWKYVGWDIGVMFPKALVDQIPPWIGLPIALSALTLSFLPFIFLPAWCLGWIRLNRRPADTVTAGEREGLRNMLAGAMLGVLWGLATMILLQSMGINLIPVRDFNGGPVF
ncbi:MAG: hypothetical protein ACK50P_21160 [Planctomycetaceae bacterium]